MRVYTGNSLKTFIEQKIDDKGITRHRFCKSKLDDFLKDNDNKVCCLYGLRRTGKTTLVCQAMKDVEDPVYIVCDNGDSYEELENTLKHLEQKYIFIDEVTKADGFINLSSSLADGFPSKRIVITGTDSAAFCFAKGDELFDRVRMIHTTYIPFAEYNYLLGKPLEDYIRYGGTLTDGHSIYNEDDLEEYTNTTIIENICKSIEKTNGKMGWNRLYDLYLNGSLVSAINKTIEMSAREFSVSIMTKEFKKSHLLGSAKDLVLKHTENMPDADIKTIRDWKDHTEICKYILDKINMRDSQGIKDSDIERITKFLVKLDVLQQSQDGTICFTQPGMQYCLTEALISSIVNTVEYQHLFPDTQRLVLNKIHEDAVGNIMERVIKEDCRRRFPELEIDKEENEDDGKFDLYILNPDMHTAAVYEIKHSKETAPKQYQHLINEDFCKAFEDKHNCKIFDKAV